MDQRRSRREFLRRAGGITLGTALSGFFPSCAEAQTVPPEPEPVVDRPNILLIISDDQSYETLDQMAGSPLDPMAKTKATLGQGIRFDKAYVPSPLCAPSRASMFTGLYPHNNGVKKNDHASTIFRRNGLNTRSLWRYLHDEAGYDCGLFGKFLNDYEETAGWVPAPFRGWASTFYNREPVKGNMNGKVRLPRQDNNSLVMRREETGFLRQRAINFMQAATEPWFVIAAVDAPHMPYTPTLKYEDSYSNQPFPVKPNFDHYDPGKPDYINPKKPLTDDEKARMRINWRGRMEELRDLDDAIQDLCDAVDFEETYVFFVSDNGFQLGEHRLFQKAYAYEESIKLPFFVRGPGTRQNTTSDLLVSSLDIPATIMELAGLDPVEKGMDGRSLVGPLFQEDESLLEWRDAFLIEQIGEFWLVPVTWCALRTADSLYVSYDDGQAEYYNTNEDPYQLSNAVGADPVRDYEMNEQLAKLRAASGDDLKAAETPTTV